MENKEILNYVDLTRQYFLIKNDILESISKVIDQADFCNGEEVCKFENNISNYFGMKYVVAVNSGTSAIFLALKALGIKAGDEIIVPANTFIASAFPITYLNAVPIFVDCDPFTWNISIESIKRKCTFRTKAVIAVHLYGQPFDVLNIKKFCKDHGLYLIEDCAQAFGATYNDQYVGTFGDISAFSFYPTKNLGACGESGAIMTDNNYYYQYIRVCRNQGSFKKYYHDMLGYNMRMDSFQAAILNCKLKYVDVWNKRRQYIAKKYNNLIQNKKITKRENEKSAKSVYHLYVVSISQRDCFLDYMRSNGVLCGLHYPVPCHLQKAYQVLEYVPGDLPNCESLSQSCVSLPLFPEMTEEEINKVILLCNSF